MKKNWMYGGVSGCLCLPWRQAVAVTPGGLLSLRGICVDDLHGESGLYNPGRGFRLETAVDVLREKDSPTGERAGGTVGEVRGGQCVTRSKLFLSYLSDR